MQGAQIGAGVSLSPLTSTTADADLSLEVHCLMMIKKWSLPSSAEMVFDKTRTKMWKKPTRYCLGQLQDTVSTLNIIGLTTFNRTTIEKPTQGALHCIFLHFVRVNGHP